MPPLHTLALERETNPRPFKNPGHTEMNENLRFCYVIKNSQKIMLIHVDMNFNILINAKLMRAQKFYFEISRESKRDLKERRGGGWGTIYKQMGVFIEN
jgi:hypothetical protein